jgi:cyclohexadienyl dehydratase
VLRSILGRQLPKLLDRLGVRRSIHNLEIIEAVLEIQSKLSLLTGRTMQRFFPKMLLAQLAMGMGASCWVVSAHADTVINRIKSSAVLRVCVWPEYYSITYRSPRDQRWSGIDIDLSAELARELGVRLQYIETSFVKLVEDVTSERCDIAMTGVGITPQRKQVLAFSQPYLQSDIYAVTNRSSRAIRDWEDIDKPGIVVAVQAGTFMATLVAADLKHAKMVVVSPPQSREQELEAGRIDVFMTDYPYSRRLLENADWAKLIAPPRSYHPIPYGYAVKPGDAQWLERVNAFVAAIKADGRLQAAAKQARLSDIVINE